MSIAATMKTHETTPIADLPSESMIAVARRQRLQDALFHRLTQFFSLLVLIALSVNLLGDWLRDALNPRLR